MGRSSKDRIISNGGRKLNRLDRENNINRDESISVWFVYCTIRFGNSLGNEIETGGASRDK